MTSELSQSLRVDPREWMATLITDDQNVRSVIFPGSHNSATRDISNVVAGGWARCQEFTITQQLEMGVRLLDLRIADNVSGTLARNGDRRNSNSDCGSGLMFCRLVSNTPESSRLDFLVEEAELQNYAEDKLWITHRFRSCKLSPVLDEIKAFIQARKQEIILLRIERDADRKLSNLGLRSLRWLILDRLGDQLLAKPDSISTIGKLRRQNRRIILCAKASFCDELQSEFKCPIALPRLDRSQVPGDVRKSMRQSMPCTAKCPERSSSMPPMPDGCTLEVRKLLDQQEAIPDLPLTPATTYPEADPAEILGEDLCHAKYDDNATCGGRAQEYKRLVSNRKTKLLCDCEISQWFLQWVLCAVPSWSWTRARKGELVYQKICRLIQRTLLEDFAAQDKLFIVEAIITHEAEAIARHPFSSIKAANKIMATDWLPKILAAIERRPNIACVSCDFVTPQLCLSIALLNRSRI